MTWIFASMLMFLSSVVMYLLIRYSFRLNILSVMQVGISLAPNVGYVNAVNAASISAVTIGAVLLFHDDFTKRKFIGVLGVTIGLVLLVL